MRAQKMAFQHISRRLKEFAEMCVRGDWRFPKDPPRCWSHIQQAQVRQRPPPWFEMAGVRAGDKAKKEHSMWQIFCLSTIWHQKERLYGTLKWYEDKCKIRCVLLCMVFVFLNKLVSWPWPSQPVLNMKSYADDLSTLINSTFGDLGFDDSPIHQSPLLQLGTVQFWAASAMIQCLVKDAETNGIKTSALALMARIHFFPLVWLFLDKSLVM